MMGASRRAAWHQRGPADAPYGNLGLDSGLDSAGDGRRRLVSAGSRLRRLPRVHFDSANGCANGRAPPSVSARLGSIGTVISTVVSG